MSPRPLAFTDEQLLAAAAATVTEVGPAELTLARVAERTGAAPATLVKRFGSKRGLLVALAARNAATIDAELGEPGPGPALPALIDRLVALTASTRTPGQLAHHVAFLAMDLADPRLRAHAGTFTDGLTAGIRRYLGVAADRGELTGVDLDRLADAVLVTYNGALISWALRPDGGLGDRLRTELRFLLSPYRR